MDIHTSSVSGGIIKPSSKKKYTKVPVKMKYIPSPSKVLPVMINQTDAALTPGRKKERSRM